MVLVSIDVLSGVHAGWVRWSGVPLRRDGGGGAGGPAVHAESCVDIRQVPLDGAYREIEPLGDLVVSVSLCDEGDDLALAVGQRHLVDDRLGGGGGGISDRPQQP